jgi:nucleoside-diphosphate kinase
MTEITFVMLKTSAEGFVEEIAKQLEENYPIIYTSLIFMDSEENRLRLVEHYKEHEGKPYYEGLMNSVAGPTMIFVLRGEGVIKKIREVIGATNPADAAEGTIRFFQIILSLFLLFLIFLLNLQEEVWQGASP